MAEQPLIPEEQDALWRACDNQIHIDLHDRATNSIKALQKQLAELAEHVEAMRVEDVDEHNGMDGDIDELEKHVIAIENQTGDRIEVLEMNVVRRLEALEGRDKAFVRLIETLERIRWPPKMLREFKQGEVAWKK